MIHMWAISDKPIILALKSCTHYVLREPIQESMRRPGSVDNLHMTT